MGAVALTCGGVVSHRGDLGTGTGIGGDLAFRTHFLCSEINVGLRYEQIGFDDDTLSRVAVRLYDQTPSVDNRIGFGKQKGIGWAYHWSEKDAEGTGPAFYYGFSLGHIRRFTVSACGAIHLWLGDEPEASAFVEATVMFGASK